MKKEKEDLGRPLGEYPIEKEDPGCTIMTPDTSIGWLEMKLPESAMSRLWSYIEEAKKNPIDAKKSLAGQIKSSLFLKDKDDWFFKTFLIPVVNKFNESFPSFERRMHILTEDAPYCLNTFWVNFQKENEFNPLHNHSGVFSFVIFMKIPTDWKEQHALPISANSNQSKASDFDFHYMNILGDFEGYRYFLSKKSEGNMLFFPAKLMHTVYPFYNCDKERISISGNIFFDISENSMREYHSQIKGQHGE